MATTSAPMAGSGTGIYAAETSKPRIQPKLDVGESMKFDPFVLTRVNPDMTTSMANARVSQKYADDLRMLGPFPIAYDIHKGGYLFTVAIGRENHKWYLGHADGLCDLGTLMVGYPELKSLLLFVLPREAFLGRNRFDSDIPKEVKTRTGLSYDGVNNILHYVDEGGLHTAIQIPLLSTEDIARTVADVLAASVGKTLV